MSHENLKQTRALSRHKIQKSSGLKNFKRKIIFDILEVSNCFETHIEIPRGIKSKSRVICYVVPQFLKKDSLVKQTERYFLVNKSFPIIESGNTHSPSQ